MAAFNYNISRYFSNFKAGFNIGFEEIRTLGKADWPSLEKIIWSYMFNNIG